MWTYEQLTGKIRDANGNTLAVGYSGFREGKNNPSLENIKDVGPIPVGLYTMESPVDTSTHGPYVIPLVPDSDNNMWERSGFLIHGDSFTHMGEASEGCIVIAKFARERMAESGDNRLKVVAFPADAGEN